MNAKRNLLLLILGSLILVACNLTVSGDTNGEATLSQEELLEAAVQTLEASESNGEADQEDAGDAPAAEEQAGDPQEPAATPTPEPTATITPTATLGAPTVTVSQNTNCRTGPGLAYELLGALLVGEVGNVVGLGQGVDYVIINNPDVAGTCWLWLEFATLAGDTSQLPQMTPPPPPTPTLTPTPEPIVNAWPIVKQGDISAEVTALQHLLRSYGYVLMVDGNFGPVTKARVQSFQMAEGLTVDGIVGPDTWSALISGKTVQNGSVGDAVKAAQSLLVNKYGYGIAIDGSFGPLTENAVEDFQTTNFLLVDGIVGPQSWQALISN